MVEVVGNEGKSGYVNDLFYWYDSILSVKNRWCKCRVVVSVGFGSKFLNEFRIGDDIVVDVV